MSIILEFSQLFKFLPLVAHLFNIHILLGRAYLHLDIFNPNLHLLLQILYIDPLMFRISIFSLIVTTRVLKELHANYPLLYNRFFNHL